MKGLLKMKLNDNFLIHDTGNGEMLIPAGEESKSFHGVIKLNSTGSELVHLLEHDDLDMDEILEHFYNEYPDSDKDEIKSAISAFIKKLQDVNAII